MDSIGRVLELFGRPMESDGLLFTSDTCPQSGKIWENEELQIMCADIMCFVYSDLLLV